MSHNQKYIESKAWKYFERVENSEAATWKKSLAIITLPQQVDYFVIYEVVRVKFNNKKCSGRTSIEEKEYAIKNEFTYLSRNHARNYIQISLI